MGAERAFAPSGPMPLPLQASAGSEWCAAGGGAGMSIVRAGARSQLPPRPNLLSLFYIPKGEKGQLHHKSIFEKSFASALQETEVSDASIGNTVCP